MSRLAVSLNGLNLKNPVITASGTYNFGLEFSELYDIGKLGGISLKGLTLEKREGNPSPRLVETYGGIINSVGLQNPGVKEFKSVYLPQLEKFDCALIANVAGSSAEDYIEIVRQVSDSAVSAIELNISCPNVKEGGASFGGCPQSIENIVGKVKKVAKKPLIVKLTPNVTNIGDNAKAAEDSGADMISLINTVGAMAIDYKSRRPMLANIAGGLSGPAIKPIALKMVYDAYKRVSIPIIGMGGISSYTDVIEFMLAGASAVQIGTANFINPYIAIEIIDDLEKYAIENNIKNISELTGALEV